MSEGTSGTRDMIRVTLRVGSVSESTSGTRDMIRMTLRVGSVSEGQFGTRKCTLIGTWAGTQGGLSRDSKRVKPGVLYGLRGQNLGQNSDQNYAETKTY